MYKDYIIGKKAVLFDLDGTIVDNLHIWERAVFNVSKTFEVAYFPNTALIYRGVSLTEIWKNYLSESKIKSLKSFDDLAKETSDEYLRLINDEVIEPRLGFWSLLDELKDKKFLIGLVSNSHKEVVDIMLKKLEINNDLFDVITTGDQVKHKKPHPEIYKLAAKKLNIKPKEALVFEDSVMGAKSAHKAGMDLIIIWAALIPEYEYPEEVFTYLDDFHSLPGNLDQTFMEYFKEEAQKAAPPGVTLQ